jgi:hypothetical protein
MKHSTASYGKHPCQLRYAAPLDALFAKYNQAAWLRPFQTGNVFFCKASSFEEEGFCAEPCIRGGAGT